MTAVALTAAQISRVDPSNDRLDNIVPAVTITVGQIVARDSDGKGILADANVSGAQQVRLLALEAGVADGPAINCMEEGGVAGFTLTSLDPDIPLYVSDTAGALDTANGTMTVPCAIIKNLTDADKTKYVHFNPRLRGDFS